MLQRGQVLFRRLSVNFALVLPFKDSLATLARSSAHACEDDTGRDGCTFLLLSACALIARILLGCLSRW